jgi:phosphoglucomutase
MHGIGLPFARQAFETAGFPPHAWLPVESQKHPDPDFPTVKFPNPEEKGALDMAMSLGRTILQTAPEQKLMIMANDPDADRFCASEWTGSVVSL